MTDERKYYVLCADNCKFESMTKEQIMTAIIQAGITGAITNVDAGFITKIKERNSEAALSFWVGTSAEYNALETKYTNCLYILTDDTTGNDLQTVIEELQTLADTITKEQNKKGVYLFGADGADIPSGEVSGIVINNVADYSILKVRAKLFGNVLCTVESSGDYHYIVGSGTGKLTNADTIYQANISIKIEAATGNVVENTSASYVISKGADDNGTETIGFITLTALQIDYIVGII